MLIPAIDISNGKCVRLTKGNFDAKTEYSGDPVDVAKEYVDYGAKIIHVVDLDASIQQGNNRDTIEEICKAVPQCTIEVGGGIRTKTDVKQLISIGVKRLVLGSVLLNDFFRVVSWIIKYNVDFIASLDMRDKKIQISGWKEDSHVDYQELLKVIDNYAFKAVNFTDVNNDGTLEGIDIAFSNTVAEQTSIPVIIGGGIGSPQHIETVVEQGHKNIAGVIIGKAIYENKVNIKELLQKYPSPSSL